MQRLMRETKFSKGWRLRKLQGEHRRSFRKTSEMSFTTKKEKKLRFRGREPKWRSEKGLSRNFKKQRTSRLDSKLNALPKRSEWRRSSLRN